MVDGRVGVVNQSEAGLIRVKYHSVSRSVRVVLLQAFSGGIEDHARCAAARRQIGVSTAVLSHIGAVGVRIHTVGIESIGSPASAEVVVSIKTETVLGSIQHVVVC
jgi:hypothetical protein